MFKELKFIKDGDLDEAELLKYVDKIVEDADWKPVFQTIIKECHKKVNAKLADVQKKMEAAPFNVKKDQCNVKWGSILTCTKVDSFDVSSPEKNSWLRLKRQIGNFQSCPKSKWTEKEECAAGKQWANECGKSFDSIMELYSKRT